MKHKKEITILAIETSCDDTGIAIIKAGLKGARDFKVLSNIIAAQIEIHAKYGGVYPTLTRREHQNNLVPVLTKSLKEAKMLKTSTSNKTKTEKLEKILEKEKDLKEKLLPFLKKYDKPKIDAIAITTGPGLEPCLWVGVNFAKALACAWELPVISVNHIKAHMFVNQLVEKELTKKDFPVLALIVSGGHTQLILMKDFGRYKILGETRDDAAGECFDKTARILGLGYPGGPIISKLAKKSGRKFGIKLPRPMINTKDYDFSFSGLKTSVLYEHLKKSAKTKKDKAYINEMCFEIQQAIIDVLIKKTLKAGMDYKVKTIILGGGVTANSELRKQFIENCRLKIKNCNLLIPPKDLCTDNGLMVAIAGHFRAMNNKFERWQDIEVNANLRVE